MSIEKTLASYPELSTLMAQNNLTREAMAGAAGSVPGAGAGQAEGGSGFEKALTLAQSVATHTSGNITGGTSLGTAPAVTTTAATPSRAAAPVPETLEQWAQLPAHRYTAPEIMKTMYSLYGHLEPHPYTGGFDNRTPLYGTQAGFQKLLGELERRGCVFNDRHYRFVDIATTGGKAPLVTANNLGARGILLPGTPQAGSGYISSDGTGHQPFHDGMFRYFADDPLMDQVMTSELVKYGGLTPEQARGLVGTATETAAAAAEGEAENGTPVYAALEDLSDLVTTVQESLSPLMAQQLYHLALSRQQTGGVEQLAQYVPYDHLNEYQQQMMPYLWAGLMARVSGESGLDLTPITEGTVTSGPGGSVLNLSELQIDQGMAEMLGGRVTGGTFYLPAYIAAAFSGSDPSVLEDRPGSGADKKA